MCNFSICCRGFSAHLSSAPIYAQILMEKEFGELPNPKNPPECISRITLKVRSSSVLICTSYHYITFTTGSILYHCVINKVPISYAINLSLMPFIYNKHFEKVFDHVDQ